MTTNKEEIDVDIMSSEELEDFEYLIQNYSKSKLAYKIIKIEEESNSYSKANFELRQENKQLKDNWNKLKEILPNVSKHYKNQFQLFSANCCEHILEIMQELERGSEK